jgi:Xaa-Pro aminopeptidase
MRAAPTLAARGQRWEDDRVTMGSSVDVINARLDRLRYEIATKDCTAVILSAPENIQYFSGFFSSTYSRPLLLFVPTAGDAMLLLPSLEEGLARRYARIPWRTYREVPPTPELRDLLRDSRQGNSHVAIEAAAMPASLYLAIKNLLSDAPLVDLGNVVQRMRAVKDWVELDLCRRAGSICLTAAEAATAITGKGARELEVKAAGEQVGYQEAARLFPDNRFWIWANVVAGCRTEAAGGHDLATGRLIKPGDVVFHVWHVSCDGYWSALVRTVLVEEVDPTVRTIHHVVREVQESIKHSLKAGANCSALANLARELLEHHGLGAHFRGIAGRGIGLSWAEVPSISLDSSDILQPGMVVRAECAVFVRDVGGFGVEDTLAISAEGSQPLTA